MEIFGLTITRTKAPPPLAPLSPLSSRGGWWPLVRESFPGAWQQNVTVDQTTALAYFAVYACITLIASDISKMTLRLVQKTEDGIWNEVETPSPFWPVLRKPNRYQSTVKFIENWVMSKLIQGNTYVLKQRDGRGLVTALYVLDPSRVTPLVAPDGSIYYQLTRDDLSTLTDALTVPASEIIHDRMPALFHPLIGVTPIYACGMAALQGNAIQNNSYKFFTNGSNPSGVLNVPGAISDETAARLKASWAEFYSGPNVGKVAVIADNMKYEPLTMSAVDAQLIEQAKWTGETICSCYHVQPYMIGIGPAPPYANFEPMVQQYHAQAIQSNIVNIETALDEGIGVREKVNGIQYGTEFDITDLIWMDTATKIKATADGIGSGGMSPDEARRIYLNLGKVKGGDTPYMQQQYYSLKALAERDSENPLGKKSPVPPPTEANTPPALPPPPKGDPALLRPAAAELMRKALAA